MENKSINRYHTFCKSLQNLGKSLAILADLLNPEVIVIGSIYTRAEKLVKDSVLQKLKEEALVLIKELEILDFAVGSPRETLQQAFANGIIEDDRWMKMLRVRNQLAHDYDGSLAEEQFQNIIGVYYPLFVKLKEDIKKKKVNTIVVLKLDRLTRSVYDMEDIMKFLEENNAYLDCANDDINTTNALI